MENFEEIEWDIFETTVAWFASIQENSEVDPGDVDDFLRRLEVVATNPVFHMELSEAAGKINYEKLKPLISKDIVEIKQVMKSYVWISKKGLAAEVEKYIFYLEKYNSKISTGETKGLKEMEKRIRQVADEYTTIISDLKLY